MTLVRRILWWLRQRSKEAQLREELQFHLEQEARERHEAGLPADQAVWAAQRDLGNEARLREDVRALWTWRPLDELSQDLRFAVRTLFKTRAVSVFAILSLALGIGANTAIYSFMDAILIRSLPIGDPASVVMLVWRGKPFNNRNNEFVMRGMDGEVYRHSAGVESRIFPFPAYERLQDVSAPVLSSLFAHKPAGRKNVMIRGAAELSDVHYVSGNFFGGLGVPPAAGRLIVGDDDRVGAPGVAVVSHGYSERRFGSVDTTVGQQILINNVPFTIVGVTPPEFFGVDPAASPAVYLPLRSEPLLDPIAEKRNQDPNFYWLEMMGRLQPGLSIAQAQSALAAPFAAWVAPTAVNDAQRLNLPALHVAEGASGLNTLRRRYSRPLYVLLAMVGLILAIACANTANLLLARATVRRREIAVRLSIGAGRFRLVRQLLTESLVLAAISGALGVVIAIAGTRLLTVLLANGDAAFTYLQVELNWRVLSITMMLSMFCGVLFGLAPAIQSTRPALVPALKDSGDGHLVRRSGRWLPRLSLQKALVVGQIAVLMLLLVAAGLFVQTVMNLHSIALGFNPENVLLFEVNAPQAGRPAATAAAFYDDLRRRLAEIPGVAAVTSSHSSLPRAGRGHPVRVDGVVTEGTRFMQTGPGFFSTMQIPIIQGREIDERDGAGSAPVAVISDQFARTFMPNQNPIGRRISVYGGPTPQQEYEIIGVAATAKYGPMKAAIPPVVYVPYYQLPPGYLQQMTFALRTDGDPLRHVDTVRRIVHSADSRVPVTNTVTQAADISKMINQEIVMARLGTTFAILALVIACVGLYGTMSYGVARRTREIGIRVALGARRGGVVWMVMREVMLLTAIGLLISIPLARGSARFVESFLFQMKPNDPRAIALALVTLIAAALLAGYAPARRASRIDPTTALREE
ncbi:MAG TPA: ABC transporter permease [Vicinamibacterales bacterium]|nr:ABC transporter permease [Vicinamibacterales bacterium]